MKVKFTISVLLTSTLTSATLGESLRYDEHFLMHYSYAVSVYGMVVVCLLSVCPLQMYCG